MTEPQEMELLTTSTEVIDRLGGNTVVASFTGVSPNAVGNWRVRGLPPETFIVLTTALNAKGLCAPPSLWRMREAVA